MSSPSEEIPPPPAEGEQVTKRRRIRACDQCRRRKVKCDGGETQGRKCSNCVTFKYECTYLAGTDKRFCDVDYVRNLENEVSDLKQLVRRLQLELATRISSGSSMDGSSSMSMAPSIIPKPPMSIRITPDVAESLDDTGPEDDQEGLIDGFRSLNVDSQSQFLGRSSTMMLIRTALDMKHEFVGRENLTETETAHGRALPSRRPEFWEAADMLYQPEPPYTDFPDGMLLRELVEDYFHHLNINFPLLYRPAFERGIKLGLHLRDEGFGATVLLVCAIGSRFCNNPTVLMTGSKNWHWAGWRWFAQVRERRKVIPMRFTSLYDVQIACLSAAYVSASASPHTTYAIVGHGLRLAQDLGAHRRMAYGPVPTVESEQKKRAFWCLLAMDRGMCSALGRPCTFHDEDIDVDLPVECDDEYWEPEDPAMAFKQPPGKPSTNQFFNCCIRLNRIHMFALRTIYSLRAPKLMGEPQKAQDIVSDIDSRLNGFIDSIPEHLKWDPHQPNLLWSSQSAILHSFYYQTQISVHRPFIPRPRKPSPLTFPSLAICTNAARSCIHVLDRQYRRVGAALFHHWHQMPLFVSAIVLLLNIWSSRRLGSTVDTAKEMEEIGKVLEMLQVLELRWNSAGRFADILRDLASDAGVPSRALQSQSQKRRRDDDTSYSTLGPQPETRSASPNTLRAIAGSKRVEQYQQSFTESMFTNNVLDSDFEFSLPVHSEDLGRIPVTSGFNFDFAGPNTWTPGVNVPLDPSSSDAMPSAGPAHLSDPSLDAILNGLFATPHYDEAFAALSQGNQNYATPVLGGDPSLGSSIPLTTSHMGPIPDLLNTASPHDPSAQGSHSIPTSWNTGQDGTSWNMNEYYPNTTTGMPRGGFHS